LAAVDSTVIDSHAEKFPSDHAALVTRFVRPKPRKGSRGQQGVRVASYNIKHGRGNDNKVDLRRAASLLDNMNVDVIGLQEVDKLTKRSGRVDQPALLAKATCMESAFGSFMPYDETGSDSPAQGQRAARSVGV